MHEALKKKRVPVGLPSSNLRAWLTKDRTTGALAYGAASKTFRIAVRPPWGQNFGLWMRANMLRKFCELFSKVWLIHCEHESHVRFGPDADVSAQLFILNFVVAVAAVAAPLEAALRYASNVEMVAILIAA